MKWQHLKKTKLKPLNSIIQVCECGKVDAYLNDGHNCGTYLNRQVEEDNIWK